MKPSVRLSRGALIAAVAVLGVASPAMSQPEDGDREEPEAVEPGEGEAEAGAAEGEVAAEAPVAAETPEPVAEVSTAVSTGYDKGFFIKSEDGKFSLTTQGRVQGRYTFESNDAGDARDEESNFAIQRARLTLGGHAFTEDVKYKFQADFGKGNVTLKDFYIDWKLSGSAYLRVGQYKRPFSRQQINSSGNLELVDRAITDKAFNAGRDIGFAIHNNYEKSPELEWAIGVFNATGDGAVPEIDVDEMGNVVDVGFSNVPALFGPAIVLRVGYNANGIKGYTEADLEGGPLRYGVGASVLAELDTDKDDDSGIRGEIDFVIKMEGLSTTGGIYVSSAQDGAQFRDQAYEQLGFHVQGGYMVTPKHQVAARFALVAPDGGDITNEVTGGFSLYQFKHGLKWQTDVGLLKTADASDILARTQLQLAF